MTDLDPQVYRNAIELLSPGIAKGAFYNGQRYCIRGAILVQWTPASADDLWETANSPIYHALENAYLAPIAEKIRTDYPDRYIEFDIDPANTAALFNNDFDTTTEEVIELLTYALELAEQRELVPA